MNDDDARGGETERAARITRAAVAGASIAHEVQNSLAVAASSVFLARRQADDPIKLRAQLDKIEREIVRAQRALEAVAALARGDPSGAARARIEPIVRAAVRDLAPPPGVVVEIEVTPIDLAGRCYPILLERAISNLATNAVEALARRSSGRVVIRAFSEGVDFGEGFDLREGFDLVVRVEDDGPGIDPDLGKALVEPLVTTKAEGTGLGLAFCRAVAEAHQGTIVLGSSALGGASVTLRLRT